MCGAPTVHSLLLDGLDGHEPHRWPRHGLAYRCRVRRIVLLPLDVGLHVAGGIRRTVDRTWRILAPNDERFRRPEADEAWRELGEELYDLLAAQLTDEDDFAFTIDAVDLEDVLGKINADGVNLHVDDPLR